MSDLSYNWELYGPQDSHLTIKGSSVGRKPFDCALMFKILILQSLYNLSNDIKEVQFLDRLSFMRFLELSICDTLPHAKTKGRQFYTANYQSHPCPGQNRLAQFGIQLE
jgi:hypothetical protein